MKNKPRRLRRKYFKSNVSPEKKPSNQTLRYANAKSDVQETRQSLFCSSVATRSVFFGTNIANIRWVEIIFLRSDEEDFRPPIVLNISKWAEAYFNVRRNLFEIVSNVLFCLKAICLMSWKIQETCLSNRHSRELSQEKLSTVCRKIILLDWDCQFCVSPILTCCELTVSAKLWLFATNHRDVSNSSFHTGIFTWSSFSLWIKFKVCLFRRRNSYHSFIDRYFASELLWKKKGLLLL